MIFHGSPYEMQTEMSRGPLAERWTPSKWDHQVNQIEGFEPWDPSHEKERAKVYRKLKSRASETVWASSYGQITILEPEIWIFWQRRGKPATVGRK